MLFNQFDVNATSSTDPNGVLLEFGLIDNVVVSRLTGLHLNRITRLANGLAACLTILAQKVDELATQAQP